MTRTILGGVLGGVAMWLVGFIFWGTPLSLIATRTTDATVGQAVQATLAEQLGPTGTGAYPIPWPGTTEGTALYAQGPTAMIFYNSSGYSVVESGALIGGLVLAIFASLLIALGLSVSRTASFGERIKLVAAFALAITLYLDIGMPVFNHMPWTYFIYQWVSDMASFMVAGAVIARWFMPRTTL